MLYAYIYNFFVVFVLPSLVNKALCVVCRYYTFSYTNNVALLCSAFRTFTFGIQVFMRTWALSIPTFGIPGRPARSPLKPKCIHFNALSLAYFRNSAFSPGFCMRPESSCLFVTDSEIDLHRGITLVALLR